MQQSAFFSLEQVIDRHPLTVTPETSLTEVIRIMQELGNRCNFVDENDENDEIGTAARSNSSCVLIVESSQLRGIFTERDLVKLIAAGTNTKSSTIGEIMTRNVVSLIAHESQDIFSVLTLMRSHNIRHLPVVDNDNNLLGLITPKTLREKLQPINLMKWRKVEEVMEKEVIYTTPDRSVRYVAQLMMENQTSYVAIGESALETDSNSSFIRPLGIITERDIVQFQNLDLDLEQPAQNLMSTPLFLIHPKETLWSVHQQMQQRRVRRLLVGDAKEVLLGIITQTSLLQIFDPTEMYTVIEALQQQVCGLEIEKTQLLASQQEELEQRVREQTHALESINEDLLNKEEILRNKVKQQQAVAEFGQFALAEKNLAPILERAVNLVASTLDVEYCKVLELLPDDKNLLLKAGVGWQDGIVGTVTIRADTNSQAGYTLLSTEPVIVQNLPQENRFSGPKLLLDHQVISGMSIIIPNIERPFGILGVHTRKHRIFSQDDVNFIIAIANIIAQTNERQQSELALRQSKEKLRVIFDQSFQFIGLLEPNGNMIEANQTALDFVGLKPLDIRGKPFWDTPWWSGSLQAQKLIQQGIEKAAMGEFVRFEVEHPGTENRVVTVDFSLTPIKDKAGKVMMLIPEGRNISDRKQAENKIREQAALLDIATDAIMVRGLDNQLLFWNQGAQRLYGWTKDEVLQQDAQELLYRRSLRKLSKIQQTAIDRGEWQGELNQVTKSGREILVKSRWTVVKDELGNPESFLIVNTDITEQKQLETQFLRTQRLESLGTLAGGIAHDLNNILAPILGFSKLLPLKLPDVDEQTKSFFKIMENNANRGSALVKQILTFSRGLEGEKGIVQTRHLIAEIAQIINETFPKSIQLETSAPKNLWTVNADVNQIHQVLINLSVNARDAMADGGTLTISAENTMVGAEYARLHLDATVGDYVLITVSDTGAGIPPEIIDRIFEPFFTTKEVGRGTGLGLSTVIGIIKSHDGFVDVISDSSRGTKFKVFLPASNIAQDNAEEPEEDLHGNGELILVVDDETAILEVTKATLETYNYQVLTASDGIKAIATYVQNQEKIKAVIMDIMMPGMDGKTAIRTLKQINPKLKIIAVSGLIERQEIIAELDGDVAAFLNKPYANEDLLRVMAMLQKV